MYHSLFGVYGSSFPKLPECPKYHKASITQLSCGFYAWIKLYFYSNILDNQSYYCDWFFLMNNFQWCGITCYWSIKKILWLIFKLRKLIGRKNRSFKKKLKDFSTFCDQLMNKFWFINRFLYFFINAHGQIEKLIAKNRSVTWNAWMEISLKTSFGAKCGVEDLALLSVYSSPFRVFGLSSPKLT